MIVCCRGIRKDGGDQRSGSSGREHAASLLIGVGFCYAQRNLILAAQSKLGEVVLVQQRKRLACIAIDQGQLCFCEHIIDSCAWGNI